MKKHILIIVGILLLSALTAIYLMPETKALATEKSTFADENGTVSTVDATVIYNTTTQISSGWYIVKGNVTTTNLVVKSNVKVILEDGCTWTAIATDNHAGIEVSNNSTLTIYGQTLGTGKLTATGSGRGAGIGGSGGSDSNTYGAGEAGQNGDGCGMVTVAGGIVTTNRLGGGNGGQGLHSREDIANGGNGGTGGIITVKSGILNVTDRIGGGDGGKSDYRRGGDGGGVNRLTVSGGILNVKNIVGGNGGDGSYTKRYDGLIFAFGEAGHGGNGGTIVFSGGKVNVSGKIGGGNAGYTSTYIKEFGRGGNGSAITIGGGNINVSGTIGRGYGSPFVNSQDGNDGSCVITGGSFNVKTLLPVPTNGSKTVRLTTITLADVKDETKLNKLSSSNSGSYGINDTYTDPQGKIYVWIPEGSSVTYVFAGNEAFKGSVAAGASGILPKMPPDTEKPAIVSLSPGSGALNVPVSGNIIIDFNEAILIDGTVTLTPSEGSSIALGKGTWTNNNTKYTVPYSGLSKGVTYHIAVEGFADYAGNVMNRDISHDFATEAPIIIPTYEFSYVDEKGNIKTANVYKVESNTTKLTTGWYAVDKNLTISNLVIIGNVRLIIKDGTTLTVSSTDHNAAIKVSKGNTLTIYGQAQGTGKINATSTGRGTGIGGSGYAPSMDGRDATGEDCGTVIINGGTITTNRIGGGDGDTYHMFTSYRGGHGGTVTINGGRVTVTDRIGGGNGGNGIPAAVAGGNGGNGSNLTINGGVVSINKICGGTAGIGYTLLIRIEGTPGGPGTLTIKGGSVQISSTQPTPKNKSYTLFLTTVTLDGVTSAKNIKAVTANLEIVYGTNDMKTDNNGKLYLWLPAEAMVSEVLLQDSRYIGYIIMGGESGKLFATSNNNYTPSLITLKPDVSENNIPSSGSIEVTFNKTMDIYRGNVILSAAGTEDILLTEGEWSYSGTKFTAYYNQLLYSTTYTVKLSGFQDTYGIVMNTFSYTFTTAAPPKSVSVGSQKGDLIATTPGSVSFTVNTISIGSSNSILLNNINNIPGISFDTAVTTGSSTEITIRITGATPAGTHPLSVTVDGATSGVFYLTVDPAIKNIILSQTVPCVFEETQAGYTPFEEHEITVFNRGNVSTGLLTITLDGEDSNCFVISDIVLSGIGVEDAGTFTIKPKDGLPPGEYYATVLVHAKDITPQVFEVSFKVNPRTSNNIISIPELTNVTIAGTNIFAYVENDFSFIELSLTVSDGASWKLFNDVACTDENTERSIILSVGTNIVFIEVSAESGSKKLYALVIVRKDAEPLMGTIDLVISGKDGTLQLEANLDDPENATWIIISGEEFITLSQSGVVTAKKNGTAIIQVNSQNGEYQEFKVTVTGQEGNPATGYDPYVYFGFLVLIVSGALYRIFRKGTKELSEFQSL